MKLQNKNLKAFTLVELIVVITILAILSTIGFVSYSSYLSGTRDTNRISQIKAISEGLYLYSTNHSLPNPDEETTRIMDGTTIQIATQGYAGANVLETITYSAEGVDPKDKTYFSYYLTKDKKYFQLMAFLEEQENLQNQAIAIDYSTRYPTVFGNKLGILTTSTNEPIQISTGSINIQNIGNLGIKSFLEDGDYIYGTGTILKRLAKVANVGGKFCNGVANKDILCKSNIEPKKIGIYYGFPSSLNNTINDFHLDMVVDNLNAFDTIVLGGGLEESTHSDNNNTIQILNGSGAWYGEWNGYTGEAYGYITLQNTISDIKISIDKWANMGVEGIFFDEAGYDFLLPYGITSKILARVHQNTAIDYAHSKGIKVILNAWLVDDVFGVSNGEIPSTIGKGDSYLLESFVYNADVSGFYDYDNQIDKIIKAQLYRDDLGIDLHCVGLFSNISEITEVEISTFYDKSFGVCNYFQITENTFGANSSGGAEAELYDFY